MTKKALVLEDFKSLAAAQQFDLLQNEGVYIGNANWANKPWCCSSSIAFMLKYGTASSGKKPIKW